MAAKVVVRDLRKRYGSIEAAKGISFEIMDGEIFGLLGPNGAGKTTALECLIGLREPDSGDIRVCGIDARREPQEVKQRIGAALQTTSLQDKITPREALALFGSFYRKPAPAGALLERFALVDKADVPFDTLSGGQRQRLALALAFVNNPELVILDEPTTGLDPQSRRELHGKIVQMKQDGHTVLLSTHYLEEAGQLCDRLAIINHGRIVATGTPRDLIGRSSASLAVDAELSAHVDAAHLAGLPGSGDIASRGTSIHFRTSSANDSVAELVRRLGERGVGLVELHVRRATLEDVFIELTGDRMNP